MRVSGTLTNIFPQSLQTRIGRASKRMNGNPNAADNLHFKRGTRTHSNSLSPLLPPSLPISHTHTQSDSSPAPESWIYIFPGQMPIVCHQSLVCFFLPHGFIPLHNALTSRDAIKQAWSMCPLYNPQREPTFNYTSHCPLDSIHYPTNCGCN
ncbi:hypothetical protein BC939DRAFT_46576 [Gamsiella multidivaricata]|uniref:uncharacterized protein n=1 Tax=Gamsiella multidivaricata TaxID=101098 RepID=UPI00221F7A76|nr:uncharacterized protein BC939DRAFT_46576 [Gamsiella multidivaricata]KAI7816347.1 hypothetical protein BC939DRAFT_46576 [Gamsiella multidivaricata]